MSFTILVLNQEEEPLYYLDSEQCDIEKTSEIGELKSIKIVYPLGDDINKIRSLFKIGNKIWIPNGDDSCLYVINSFSKYDFWENNHVEIEAEEVLVELNFVELFQQGTAETRTINASFLESEFGNYFNIGTVESCMGSRGKVSLNGTMTKLELLRYIEEETSNIFITRYEKDAETNVIHRYLDFLQPSHAGVEHDTVIDLSFNAENIEYETDESNTYRGIAPVLSLKTDDSANTMTRQDLGKVISDWKALAVKKGETIPMIVEKENVTNADGSTTVVETITAYWSAPFKKLAGELFIRDDVNTGVEYEKILSRPDAATPAITTPKIGTVSTSDTNKYSIYNDCAVALIDKRYPQLDLEVDLKDLNQILSENSTFNLYDKVYVKIPEYDSLIRAQVGKIETDPHLPGDTKISLTNAEVGTRINQKATSISASDVTVKKGKYISAVLSDENGAKLDKKVCSISITKGESTVTTTKTVTSTQTVAKKEGSGVHVFMNTDNINSKSKDKKLMNDIAEYLRKRGYSVTVGGIGPSTHYADIGKVKKNGVYFTLYGGLCAGTLKEQCYSNHYHSVLKSRNAKMVIGLYNRVLTDKFLPRAHDDNFSPSSFKGWSKPRSSLLKAGIGIAEGKSASEIANNFPGYKTTPKTTTVTKKTPVTTTTTEKGWTKTYSMKTDANGVFKLKISSGKGEYTVKYQFGGDIEYGGSSKTVKLKVI